MGNKETHKWVIFLCSTPFSTPAFFFCNAMHVSHPPSPFCLSLHDFLPAFIASESSLERVLRWEEILISWEAEESSALQSCQRFRGDSGLSSPRADTQTGGVSSETQPAHGKRSERQGFVLCVKAEDTDGQRSPFWNYKDYMKCC